MARQPQVVDKTNEANDVLKEYNLEEGTGQIVPVDLYSDRVITIPVDADVNEYNLMLVVPLDKLLAERKVKSSTVIWRANLATKKSTSRCVNPYVRTISNEMTGLLGVVAELGFGRCTGLSRSLNFEYRLMPGSRPQGLVCACFISDGFGRDLTEFWYRCYILHFGVNEGKRSESYSLLYLFDADYYAWVQSESLRYLPSQFSYSRFPFPRSVVGAHKRSPPKPDLTLPDEEKLGDEVEDDPTEIDKIIPIERDLLKVACHLQVINFNPCKPFTFKFGEIHSPSDFELIPSFMPYVKFPGIDGAVTEAEFDESLACEMSDAENAVKLGVPLHWVEEFLARRARGEQCQFICAGRPRTAVLEEWRRVSVIERVHPSHPLVFKVKDLDLRFAHGDIKGKDIFVCHLLQMRLLPNHYLKRPIFLFKAALAYVQPTDAKENVDWKEPVWTNEPVEDAFPGNWELLTPKDLRDKRPPARTAAERMRDMADNLSFGVGELTVATVWGIKDMEGPNQKHLVDICDLRQCEKDVEGKAHYLTEVLCKEGYVKYAPACVSENGESMVLNEEHRYKYVEHLKKWLLHYQRMREKLMDSNYYEQRAAQFKQKKNQ